MLPCHARLPRADERKKLRMNRFDLERYGRTQLGLEVGSTCYVRGGLGEHAGAVADGVMCVVSCRGCGTA